MSTATRNVQESPIAIEDVRTLAQRLEKLDASARVDWALDNLPATHVLTSSFGAQAAVSLHLVTRANPDLPVVLIDTGYLFPETYQFVDALADQLQLNLHVARPTISAAWQEARHGKRWQDPGQGLDSYLKDNKFDPLLTMLDTLETGTWFAGLRRAQSQGRAERAVLEAVGQRWKVHPIVDWSDRDVHRYLKRHRLPYHPLWESGYLSIGDVHSTQSIHEVDNVTELRFGGSRRECGIHGTDRST
ncbi:MAG: phosphoadenylyl-sulfate reductase [Pseudomonadota bacterium]